MAYSHHLVVTLRYRKGKEPESKGEEPQDCTFLIRKSDNIVHPDRLKLLIPVGSGKFKYFLRNIVTT